MAALPSPATVGIDTFLSEDDGPLPSIADHVAQLREADRAFAPLCPRGVLVDVVIGNPESERSAYRLIGIDHASGPDLSWPRDFTAHDSRAWTGRVAVSLLRRVIEFLFGREVSARHAPADVVR